MQCGSIGRYGLGAGHFEAPEWSAVIVVAASGAEYGFAFGMDLPKVVCRVYGVGKVPVVVLVLVEAFLVADAVGDASNEPGCADGRGVCLGLLAGVFLFGLVVGLFSFSLVVQGASWLDPFIGRVLWLGFLVKPFAEGGGRG